jgi:DNA-binding NarL/FixJ family response regulator
MQQQTQARIHWLAWLSSFARRLSLETVGGKRRDHKNDVVLSGTEAGQTVVKVRVLLADDNETIVARVRAVLGDEFDIVGALANGRDAIAAVRRLDPDVLLIDISMPILDGLQAVSRLGSSLRTKVVFLTVHEDQDFIDAAFAVGASGYVAKSDVTTDLIPAILKVLKGQTYVSKSIHH